MAVTELTSQSFHYFFPNLIESNAHDHRAQPRSIMQNLFPCHSSISGLSSTKASTRSPLAVNISLTTFPWPLAPNKYIVV